MPDSRQVVPVSDPVGRLVRAKRRRGYGYDFRDDPQEAGTTATCEFCKNRARWAVARPEDWKDDGLAHPGDFDWRIRAFACGTHMHAVLDSLDWLMDVVQVYDLAQIPEGGC